LTWKTWRMDIELRADGSVMCRQERKGYTGVREPNW
jgi:hypothetical protein